MYRVGSRLRLVGLVFALSTWPGALAAQQRAAPLLHQAPSLRWSELVGASGPSPVATGALRTQVTRVRGFEPTAAVTDSLAWDSPAAARKSHRGRNAMIGAGIGAGVGLVLTRTLWNGFTDYASYGPEAKDYFAVAAFLGAIGAGLGALIP